MALATENLYRATNDFTLVRAEVEGGMPTMTGHFAVWNQWTQIRSVYENKGRPFLERFAPASMHKTLAENQRMKVMFNHGKDPSVGEKLLGVPTRLEPDDGGALYEVPLFDTSYNRDLLPGLESGAYGASMRFSVEQENYVERPPKSDHNPLGLPERTVTEARVAEFGPVSFPAYGGATAGLRSITDAILMERFLDDDETLDRLAQRLSDKQRVSVYFGAAVQPEMTVAPTSYAAALIDAPEDQRAETDLEPEPSEAATPAPPDSEPAPATRTEPEPSEATTRSVADLCWFADTSKLKGAN